MIEVLKSFEQEASRFSPLVLIVPGLAMVVFGLIAWLAGMCLRRLVLAGAGATAGGLAGWLVYGQNPAVAGLAAGGGAVLAALWPRLSTAILLAAFGVAVAFVITARTQSVVEGHKSPGGRPGAGRVEKWLSGPESLAQMRVFALDAVGRTRVIAGEMERVNLVVIATVGLVLLVAGLLFVRLAGATAFSILGTASIFAGLILLLMYKGSAPVTIVQNRGPFYELVVVGMAAFGTLEQLVLCPAPRRERQAGSAGSGSGQREAEHSWRNR